MNGWSLKILKRQIVAIIGVTILIIGIAMIVLPGPAIIAIPLALAILATEFAWARRALHRVRNHIQSRNNKNNHKEQYP